MKLVLVDEEFTGSGKGSGSVMMMDVRVGGDSCGDGYQFVCYLF